MTPQQAQTALQWESARDEARDLDKYGSNWDGEGADAVSLDLINTTLRWFRGLEDRGHPAPVSIYPLADGTPMIEWHHPGGSTESANIRVGNRVEIVLHLVGEKPLFTASTLAKIVGGERFQDPSPAESTAQMDEEYSFAVAA